MSRALPTAAPAIWPYPHRTIAEVEAAERADVLRRHPRLPHYCALQIKRGAA